MQCLFTRDSLFAKTMWHCCQIFSGTRLQRDSVVYFDREENFQEERVATAMANINFCLILLTPLLVIISMFEKIKLCLIHKALYWGWNGARQWVSTCSTLHGQHGAAGEPLAWEILKHLKSMMHHGESWWRWSPKNLEPVLCQAGGANLWGWGGPGANIQVAWKRQWWKDNKKEIVK